MAMHTEDDMTDLAKQAGITVEDMDFLQLTMVKLLMGSMMGVRTYTMEDIDRVLVIYEKLQEVKPDALPPEVGQVINRLREKAKGQG